MDNLLLLLDSIYSNFIREINDNKKLYNVFINAFENNTYINFLKSISLDNIDLKWLNPVEESLKSFDEIIKNPMHYIEVNEDLVKVERSREINSESIRHLAKNSKYIQKYNEKEIIPNKILNNTKEDTLKTYENRFVFTLLKRLEIFIDKRIDVLKKNYLIDDSSVLKINGESNLLGGLFSYDVNLKFSTFKKNDDFIYDLDYDTTSLNTYLRIKRIKNILDGFNNTYFYRELKKVPLLNSEIIMTNVLLNNVNFMNLVSLWHFLNNYDEGNNNEELFKQNEELKEYFYNEMKSILTISLSSFQRLINRKTNDIIELNEYDNVKDELKGVKDNIKYVLEEEKTIKLKEDSYFIMKYKNILKRAIHNG